MSARMTWGRVTTAGVVAVLSVAVLLVWLITGSQSADESGSLTAHEKALRAVAGGPDLDGRCFVTGEFLIAEPDPDELQLLIRAKGSNARLQPGTEAAPSADALAERTGGDLVAVESGEAHLLYVDGAQRRVETYTRFAASGGDWVWLMSGNLAPTPCEDG